MRTSSKAPDSFAACRYRLPPRHPLPPRPHDVRREGRQSPRPETCRKRRRTKLLVRIHETGAGSPRSRDSRQKRTVGLWLSRRRRVIRLRCLHRTPLLVFDAPAAGLGGLEIGRGATSGCLAGDGFEEKKREERDPRKMSGAGLIGQEGCCWEGDTNSIRWARRGNRRGSRVRCGAVRCGAASAAAACAMRRCGRTPQKASLVGCIHTSTGFGSAATPRIILQSLTLSRLIKFFFQNKSNTSNPPFSHNNMHESRRSRLRVFEPARRVTKWTGFLQQVLCV
jgi:hypothetical protein